jgi:hypothetical protein
MGERAADGPAVLVLWGSRRRAVRKSAPAAAWTPGIRKPRWDRDGLGRARTRAAASVATAVTKSAHSAQHTRLTARRIAESVIGRPKKWWTWWALGRLVGSPPPSASRNQGTPMTSTSKPAAALAAVVRVRI